MLQYAFIRWSFINSSPESCGSKHLKNVIKKYQKLAIQHLFQETQIQIHTHTHVYIKEYTCKYVFNMNSNGLELQIFLSPLTQDILNICLERKRSFFPLYERMWVFQTSAEMCMLHWHKGSFTLMKTRIGKFKQSLHTLPGLNSSFKAFIWTELPLGVSTYLDLFVLYSPSIK